MIDIHEVVKQLTVEDIKGIMESLDCGDYIEHEKEIIFRTCCHNENPEEGSHKLYYYKNSGLFVCYTCCGTFDIAGLLCRRYETLGQEYNFYKDVVLRLAAKVNYKEQHKISSFYQPYDLQFNQYKLKEVNVNLNHLNPNILNSFSNHLVQEWKDDGITEEVAKQYQIRYSIDENKVIIPHYNEEGFLIGIRGRALDPIEIETQGKYRPITYKDKILSHPLGFNLYGFDMVKGNIKRIKMAIVVEGEKSVLQYCSYFGHQNNIVVAACGSNLSEYQINLLLKCGTEKILIAFDKEGKTPQEQEKYYKKLENICKKFKNKVNIGFIWDNQNLLNLKDSPMDKGKDIFLQLYWRNTVWL